MGCKDGCRLWLWKDEHFEHGRLDGDKREGGMWPWGWRTEGMDGRAQVGRQMEICEALGMETGWRGGCDWPGAMGTDGWREKLWGWREGNGDYWVVGEGVDGGRDVAGGRLRL